MSVNKFSFGLLLMLVMLCGSALGEEIPINEIPMYGNLLPTESQKRADETLIKEITQKAESRELGAKRAIERAWQYIYLENDQRTAMKRFNQAWLLDPHNAEVFYGFGFLMSLQGKTDKAIIFYKKALSIDGRHAMALANLGRSIKNQAYALYVKGNCGVPNKKVKRLLTFALSYYNLACFNAPHSSKLRKTDLESDLRYIYYQWAVALEFKENYAQAWEKIKLCKKHGGDSIIEPAFIRELSHFMPEPMEK